jgi:hypothetical protein
MQNRHIGELIEHKGLIFRKNAYYGYVVPSEMF